MKIADMPGSSLERADWSEVRGFSHEMKYPFDMREAKGRGEPEHGACTVLKELDKASPKLYEALAKKKKINSVEIEFERDKPGEGATEVYFKITLSDCRLIYARPHIPGPASATRTRRRTWTRSASPTARSTGSGCLAASCPPPSTSRLPELGPVEPTTQRAPQDPRGARSTSGQLGTAAREVVAACSSGGRRARDR
ncbi:MAG: type VI secretion system tube protein Hcp [Planctomycetota bacterium]